MSSTPFRSTNARAHYKVTRTATGPDGKTHTETIEMYDDDAVKVSMLIYSNRYDEIIIIICSSSITVHAQFTLESGRSSGF